MACLTSARSRTFCTSSGLCRIQISSRALGTKSYGPDVVYSGNVYLLFELIDYATDNFKNMPEGGWHRIAWGFLKLVSKNQGKPKVSLIRSIFVICPVLRCVSTNMQPLLQANIDVEVSVQLFEYTNVFPDSSDRLQDGCPAAPGVLENFKEFVSGKPKTYPSTLHVTVTHAPRPDKREVTERPKSIFQKEVRSALL